LNDWIGRVG